MIHALNSFEQRMLLFSVFILSLCGIIYELVLGSLATYLLGNPVQQYSVTIGFFLSSMGLGSYISRYIVRDLVESFVRIEITLGLAGGVSVILLNYIFSFSTSFYLVHIFFLVLIGSLVGLEIPLLTRILKKNGPLKDIISSVLTLDYMGGLAGSLLFPLLLFPFLGRYLTSLLVGMVNIGVAIFVLVKLTDYTRKKTDLGYALVSMLILVLLTAGSDWVEAVLLKRMFCDDVMFIKRSKYQEIVLTRNGDDFRLYLDGSIQFSTSDEYRYHEMLVCPPVLMCGEKPLEVLVMGGGDGLAVRELLKFGNVRNVTLIELDRYITDLAINNSTMKHINNGSLTDKRVQVIIGDAFQYLAGSSREFDLIIADFPDPHDETISKLYTDSFYMMVKRSLKPGGIFTTQSTSPFSAREAFWCINSTLAGIFRHTLPCHIYVPTFGDWGFNIASDSELKISAGMEPGHTTRFFTMDTYRTSLDFPADSKKVATKINTFNKPVLYSYYLKGWKNSDN